MSSEVEMAFKKINKRFITVEKPILDKIELVIGSQRVKRLQSYLTQKRKAEIQGIPPIDAMSKMVEELFEHNLEDNTIQDLCDNASQNYAELDMALYEALDGFLKSANKGSLVDMSDLSDITLVINKNESSKFTNLPDPKLLDDGTMDTKKGEDSPDYVTRARTMAKVLNDKLSQPLRGMATQVSLTEKLDNLCKYILIKESDPNVETIENHLDQLNNLIDKVRENKELSDKDLDQISAIVGHKDTKYNSIERLKDLLKVIKVDGKTPKEINEILQKKIEYEDKKKTIPIKPPTMTQYPNPDDINILESHTFSPAQIDSLKKVLTVLSEQVRDEDGYFEFKTMKNKKGQDILTIENSRKMNEVIKEFYSAWESEVGDKFLKNLDSKKPTDKAEIVNSFVDIFTQKGLSKPQSIGSRVKDAITKNPDDFDDKFKDYFGKISSLEDSSHISDLFKSGDLLSSLKVKDIKDLNKQIIKYKCESNKDAKGLVLNIIDIYNAKSELQSVLKNEMRLDVNLSKAKPIDLEDIRDNVIQACLNPALSETEHEISELPESLNINDIISTTTITPTSEELLIDKINSRKGSKIDKQRYASELVGAIWDLAKNEDNNFEISEYERLKFDIGWKSTSISNFKKYIESLKKEGFSKESEPEPEIEPKPKSLKKTTKKKTTRKKKIPAKRKTLREEMIEEQPEKIPLQSKISESTTALQDIPEIETEEDEELQKEQVDADKAVMEATKQMVQATEKSAKITKKKMAKKVAKRKRGRQKGDTLKVLSERKKVKEEDK